MSVDYCFHKIKGLKMSVDYCFHKIKGLKMSVDYCFHKIKGLKMSVDYCFHKIKAHESLNRTLFYSDNAKPVQMICARAFSEHWRSSCLPTCECFVCCRSYGIELCIGNCALHAFFFFFFLHF